LPKLPNVVQRRYSGSEN